MIQIVEIKKKDNVFGQNGYQHYRAFVKIGN